MGLYVPGMSSLPYPLGLTVEHAGTPGALAGGKGGPEGNRLPVWLASEGTFKVAISPEGNRDNGS